MPAKIKFKKLVLAHCMHSIFNTNDINKLLCASVFLSVFATSLSHADEVSTVPTTSQSSTKIPSDSVEQLKTIAQEQGSSNAEVAQIDDKVAQINQQSSVDSLSMLQQQEKNQGVGNDFKPIQFDDLEELPTAPIDSSMVNEIYQVAEQAKVEAQNFRAGVTKTPEVEVADITKQELTEISQAPVNVDQLMSSIKADSKIVVEANESGKTLTDFTASDEQETAQSHNIFKRLFYKVRPPKADVVKIARISAEVVGAPTILANNIKAKLSTFTVDAFSDFNASTPQLRTLSTQAAQAVGYYNAQFKFQKVSDNKVKVTVTPNDPVIIAEQNIEFSGAGAKLPQLQVIRVLPDQDVGDILNHADYETTKSRISDAAINNGFFDSYWRLHDVKVAQPQNKADINLRYETGERYKLADVEFRMSDPTKPLPIDLKILKTMVSWKDGADYTAWRVNGLANNLTNSRYFNYTLVDAVKPDPIQKPLELPPDVQVLLDQQQVSESALVAQNKPEDPVKSSKEVTQNVVDENQFAGTKTDEANPNLRQLQTQQQDKDSEDEKLQEQARIDKKIPVIVTLNADKLNSLEAGIGYGTDTGVRLRGQYRRAIVNHLGHSFDANMELSQIRQSFDGRYNIPYNHPLNDYVSLVGGYEREERNEIGNDLSLVIESAVIGVDRIIKGSRKDWQHIFGARYRLDRVNQSSIVDTSDIPDAFLIPGAKPEQQSLLLGYEVSKITSNQRLNPTQGFKQSYKIEVGSKAVLSDADMAIASANWKGLYSLGENDDHQFLAGANLAYIFTNDFEKVPYNLRFFAGGDQSLRGFDYKSLSPVEYGYKVGGQALAVGTVEYNYQFKDGWRAAVFSDFGNAYDKTFSNETAYNIGFGIRWKSPIGPIRLDVASGISDPDHPIRLHFFIGSQL